LRGVKPDYASPWHNYVSVSDDLVRCDDSAWQHHGELRNRCGRIDESCGRNLAAHAAIRIYVLRPGEFL
jgi:hypothetical protein